MKGFRFWDNLKVLAVTPAILLGLSFPPFDLSILQIPAFICLFRLAVVSSDVRELILFSYPSFVLWNLFVTYWLMMATVTGGIAAILANSLIMLVPMIIIRKLLLSEINPVFAAFLIAATWVSYEFLHHNWDLAWPWLTLGNGWSNLTGAIQFISVTGVFGITFWVIFSAALFFSYMQKPVKPTMISACIVLFAFPVFSVLSMVSQTQYDGDPIEVAVIQPNSDSYQPFGGFSSIDELMDKLLALSADVVTNETDLVLWPENAVDSALSFENPHFERIRDSLRVWNTTLITGSGYVEFYDEDNRPEVARMNQSGQLYNVFNSAFYLRSDHPSSIYKKGKLVPIVERMPFVEFLQKADLFGWIDWGTNSGYGEGTEPVTFEINGLITPALICYDSVFSGWVNRFVDEGANFLTIITNDGWWGDSHGHIQHFAYARLRAIEHRMWIARSANNGISGIISPDGKVQAATEYWTEDAFTFRIYSSDKRTFYSRHGNWIGWFSLFFAIPATGFIYIRRPRKKIITG